MSAGLSSAWGVPRWERGLIYNFASGCWIGSVPVRAAASYLGYLTPPSFRLLAIIPSSSTTLLCRWHVAAGRYPRSMPPIRIALAHDRARLGPCPTIPINWCVARLPWIIGWQDRLGSVIPWSLVKGVPAVDWHFPSLQKSVFKHSKLHVLVSGSASPKGQGCKPRLSFTCEPYFFFGHSDNDYHWFKRNLEFLKLAQSHKNPPADSHARKKKKNHNDLKLSMCSWSGCSHPSKYISFRLPGISKSFRAKQNDRGGKD